MACNNYLIDLPRVNDVRDEEVIYEPLMDILRCPGFNRKLCAQSGVDLHCNRQSKPFHWLFAGKAAAALALNADASGLLDGTEPFVFSGLTFKDLPPGWKAIPIGAFKRLGDV